MTLAFEYLELAERLANLSPETPRQANLRRAVSTAYYALFHLLIDAAASNWNRPEQRAAFARIFDHGKMRNASENKVKEIEKYFKAKPLAGAQFDIAKRLHTVAKVFIQVQQMRNDADYDSASEWTRVDVLAQIESVEEAFKSWALIREEPDAQAFLFSFLKKDRAAGQAPLPLQVDQ